MKFTFTHDEAQFPARTVAAHLRQRQMNVRVEAPLRSDTPYRTTLLATKSGLYVLVEAQGTLEYHPALRELARWMAGNRTYAELYIATVSNASMPVSSLEAMRSDGVGLFVVDTDRRVTVVESALNHALVVTPEPTLALGACRREVMNAVRKFNRVDRRDGLRDMCEIVERETENLAVLTVRRGGFAKTEQIVRAMDWATQINTLASPNLYNAGYNPILSDPLKTDLHSFRGARNLVDHAPTGRRGDARRQRQYAERMMQGPRLVAELLTLKRSLR